MKLFLTPARALNYKQIINLSISYLFSYQKTVGGDPGPWKKRPLIDLNRLGYARTPAHLELSLGAHSIAGATPGRGAQCTKWIMLEVAMHRITPSLRGMVVQQLATPRTQYWYINGDKNSEKDHFWTRYFFVFFFLFWICGVAAHFGPVVHFAR